MTPQTPQRPAVKTRFSCEQTNGYNVKRGTNYYEWCPFCGHSTEDDDHDIVVTVRD